MLYYATVLNHSNFDLSSQESFINRLTSPEAVHKCYVCSVESGHTSIIVLTYLQKQVGCVPHYSCLSLFDT